LRTTGPDRIRRMKCSIFLCFFVLSLCYEHPTYVDETVLSKLGATRTFWDDFNTFSWYGNNPPGTWKTWFYFAWDKKNDADGRTLSGNDELEYYSDPIVGVNPFSARNSILYITANRGNNLPKNSKGNQLQYTSGLITTETSFSQVYGYFEMRAQLPWGKGFWPAFWLLTEDHQWPPEIDVLEAFGSPNSHGEGHNNQIHYGVHASKSPSWGNWVNTPDNSNITSGFHKYGLMWTSTTISFYYDGKQVATGAAPAEYANRKMYMLVNLAVGGGWPENPNSQTPFPSVMQVDYVSAYSL